MKPTALALSGLMFAAPVLQAQTPTVRELPAVTVAEDAVVNPNTDVSLTREDWFLRGADNLAQALRGEPGLAMSSDGTQGQNPVVRGLKKESVVLLIDGMQLHAAQPVGALAGFVDLALAQRLDVVKGPTSVQYGSGALGGVLSVQMPQARFVPGVSGQGGLSYDSAAQALRATAVAQLANDGHAFMLGGSQAQVGDSMSAQGVVPRSGFASEGWIGQYRLRVDAANEWRASWQQHTDRDVWYPGSTRSHPHPQVQSTTVHAPNQSYSVVETGWTHRLAGEHGADIDVRAYRQSVKRELFSYANGALARDIARNQVDFATDGLDARVHWLVASEHLLSMGMNLWRMAASPERWQPSPANNPANALARSDPFSNARVASSGLYLQDDIRWGQLGLVLGLRHDLVQGDADWVGTPANTANLSRADRLWSGSLSAAYALSPLVRPYVQLSRGARAAEMRERFESAPRADGSFYAGNPQIRPEIATQTELGLKGGTEAWEYSAALWQTRIGDYITGQDISGTAQAASACGAANASACKLSVNLGQATLHGVEAQARWQWRPGQWLRVALSALRGTNEDLAEPLFQMPADELHMGWQGRLDAQWTMDAQWRLVRGQDRVASVFSRGSENDTAGFATVDLGATWHQGAHSLRLAVKNLADKAYHEHLTEGASGQEMRAPGRSLYLAYSGKF